MIEKEEKKSPRIAELAVVIGVIVSILVAATSLLSNSGNLPLWWFYSSLILLVILALSMPIMVFAKPFREGIREVRLKRKRDSVSRKYASQFKDLVASSRTFNYGIRETMDSLRSYYANEIKSQLVMFIMQDYSPTQQEIDNILFNVEKDIQTSDKTSRDLYLAMIRFESVLDTYTRNLKITEVFVREIMSSTGKPLPIGIEANFEAFREKYNDFIKDVNDLCHKINQESLSQYFPELSFEYLKKWFYLPH